MLIPVALVLGGIGLVGFLWALRSGQFDDLDGAANRVLFDYDEPKKAPPAADSPTDPAQKPPHDPSAHASSDGAT